MTQCSDPPLLFHDLGDRQVVARFDGGAVTSDAGGLLLRAVEQRFGFIAQFARCFTDHRAPERITFSVETLLRQRLFGLCLGYEDLNDHDRLRTDPLLAVLAEQPDPTAPLAGKSTLNRLELTPVRASAGSRYCKISARLDAIAAFLVEAFIQQQATPPARLVLDLDATDATVHGHQLGRFFHGYYGDYCYLPLYVFCGDHPLVARLRPADIDAAAGALKQVQRLVARLRQQWPGVAIVLRGDSGFCREHLLRWCEANGVDYVFGLAKNQRLQRILGAELHQARQQFAQTREAARVFKDFTYQTRKSWNRARRVVGKAEHLAKGPNPRFVVTSLPAAAYPAQTLYEVEYCGRGDMENRIKEQQRMLFANRLSCATMRANQLRLYLATVAYVILRALRAVGLRATPLATAQCGTIRTRLLKIGAVVRVTVRKVWVALAEAYPLRAVFTQACANLRPAPQPLPTG